jgi:ABC-2 type transport system permease protein
MFSVLRSPIRSSAFLRKEIFEVLRQPRLVLTLVLGPFLLLLLVGLGYRNEPRTFRALFVVPGDRPALADEVREYAASLGPQFILAGLVSDETQAKAQLRRGDVDLAVVIPPDAYESIRANTQAELLVYHNEIDPFQVSYVDFIGQFYADQVNRRILRTVLEQSQTDAAQVEDDVAQAQASATALREALERGDASAARQHQGDLDQNVSALDLAVGASAGVLSQIAETTGFSDGETEAAAILDRLASVRQNTDELSNLSGDCGSCAAEIQRARETEADLAELDTRLEEFRQTDPGILVSPFRSRTEGVAILQPRVTDFFTPAVLALLLQHLSVTFAALSIVREREIGAVELFRVSPLSASEALLGKYLSYLSFGGILAAILTGLVTTLMGVPMLGNWWNYALVVGGLLFASLGLGFVISLFAQTDSQAVQYSMLSLLASVFFSGLFLNLNLLWEPIRILSWLLPATYGMTLLQDIMLRGLPPSPLLVTGLVAIGLLLFMVALTRMKRLMAHG